MLFKGKFAFLSNFILVPIEFEGALYRSVEHAYIAAKTTDETLRAHVRTLKKPSDAKKWGKTIPLREDWDSVKDNFMENFLRQKFSVKNTELLTKLILVEDEIVEENYWHDVYWGKCTCKTHLGSGQNRLGQILTQIRAEALSNDDVSFKQ